MKRILLTVAAAGALLAIPSAALADETITAVPVNKFSNSGVVIDQGERVFLQNNDSAQHNVTSDQQSRLNGSNNGFLFASGTIGQGQTSQVKGTEFLTTGNYSYLCTLHPEMTGTLTVNSSGTPVPRIEVKVRGSSLDKVVDSRRLKLRVEATGPVSLDLKARVKGVGTIAKKSDVEVEPGGETVRLKLKRSARRELDDRNRAKIRLTARGTDSAGRELAPDSARKTLR